MSLLFSEACIGAITCTNRLIRSATLEGLADGNGGCGKGLVQLYENLSQGGAGLIITGHMFVSGEGRASNYQLGLHNDTVIAGCRTLTEAVHGHEVKVIAQLAHAGVYAIPEAEAAIPLTPSVGAIKTDRGQKACDEHDLHALVTAFKDAAERAYSAGFDGIQLHAAHGYLLSQFLSPLYNKRSDGYGGNVEKRARLICQIVRAIRESLGKEYPILVKINCSDFYEGGLSVDDSVATARLLEREGIDGIEISGGLLFSRRLGPVRPHINSIEKEAYFEEEAARIKKVIHIPLLLVGGIRSFETAESLLEQGVCDFVSMCRPFICEPGIVGRWKAGDTTKSRCNSDNLCFRPILNGDGVRCVTFSEQ